MDVAPKIIDNTTIDVVATSTKGDSVTLVSSGVIDAAQSGSIQANDLNGYDIVLQWPDLENLVRWTITIDVTNVVGQSA